MEVAPAVDRPDANRPQSSILEPTAEHILLLGLESDIAILHSPFLAKPKRFASTTSIHKGKSSKGKIVVPFKEQRQANISVQELASEKQHKKQKKKKCVVAGVDHI